MFRNPNCASCRHVLLAVVLSLAGHVAADSDTALVVVIAVDQLRDDRLSENLAGGLARLVREGRRFVNTNLDHGLTMTCPGHAALITGVQPGRAGIPGNTYIDRNTWQNRYCVEDDDLSHRVLGGIDNRSPEILQVSAFGDWLKAGDPQRRVYSLAGKDRAAIIMGGRSPDAAYWFDAGQAAFTSSGYYSRELPDYIRQFNSELVQRLPQRWEHPPGTHRLDDFAGESEENGRVSGHPVASGEAVGRQIAQSPFLDEITLDLAKQVVIEAQLGMRGRLDMLALSLSAMDTVGHLYGPFSAESEDALRRLDTGLAEFLGFLDDRIGRDRYVVALSSDHGITDLPEWSLHQGTNGCPVPGSRIPLWKLISSVFGRIYWRHTFPFDSPTALVRYADSQLYLNAGYLQEKKLDPESVLGSLVQILESTPGVLKAWTLAEIEQGRDESARLLRNSLVPGLSGDLLLQFHPDCMVGDTGTTHGSLYTQDRSVPLVFYGRGISPGTVSTPAHSIDLAPTLAHLLGVELPAELDGRVFDLKL